MADVLLRMSIRYYPDADNREKKAEYLLVSVVSSPSLTDDTSETVCEIRSRWLDKPHRLPLRGFSSRPGILPLAWAALSALLMGLDDVGETVGMPVKSPLGETPSSKFAPRVLRRKRSDL